VPALKDLDVAILCGGLGKRLRKEVGETQKTMISFDGEPFLNLQLEHLAKQGLKRIILCTGHQAQEVEKFYTTNKFGLDIVFSRENEPLGTGGAIKNTKGLIQNNPFFALNGDCFCPIDYRKFLDFYYQKQAVMALVLSQMKDLKDFGTISVDEAFRIVSFNEKTDQRNASVVYGNAGIYCFNKDVFSLMPKENSFSIEYDFFAKIPVKEFFGFVVGQEFIDIGTPDRLEHARQMLRKGE